MQEYWAMATDPAEPRWNQKRASAGKASIDPAMVRLIAELTGIGEAVAMENVKKASKETLEALKVKYAEKYQAIAKEIAQEVGSVDLNDLL